MNVKVILQDYRRRPSPLAPFRINGKPYKFDWDEKVKAYAYPVDTIEQANTVIKAVAAFSLTPGIALCEDPATAPKPEPKDPAEPETPAAPAPEAVPAPEATPEPPAAPAQEEPAKSGKPAKAKGKGKD